MQQNALRIACKKLRYSAELFSPLYAGSRARDYLAALAKLQDILGEMNDAAVAHRLLKELDTAAQHEMIVSMHEWIESGNTKRMARLDKCWQKFSGQKTFWD
jgi:triphosphatase